MNKVKHFQEVQCKCFVVEVTIIIVHVYRSLTNTGKPNVFLM